jgi:hypothetical protein
MPGWPDPRLDHLISLTCQWWKIAGECRDTRPLPQPSPDRALCAAGHPRAGKREAGARASLGLRMRGARDQARRRKGNCRPRRITGQREGSRRLASRPVSPGFCVRLAGASRAAYNTGPRNRAPCRSLTAGRSEASRCFAPVAGERRLGPRSHGHGTAVHPCIAPPPHRMPALGQRTSRPATRPPSSTSLPVTCPCSWLTRTAPFCPGTERCDAVCWRCAGRVVVIRPAEAFPERPADQGLA